MTSVASALNQFADRVSTASRHRGRRGISETVISAIASELYAASLRTEEAASIRCHVAYLNPKRPDPSPPRRIVRDRWVVVPFRTQIPFTADSIVKLARASDPRSSSLAVYKQGRSKATIWGLIDQGNSWHQFAHHDTDSGMERPGLVQINIEGIGHLVAYRGFEKLAELKHNKVRSTSIDVLSSGTLSQLLISNLSSSADAVRLSLPSYCREHEFAQDCSDIYWDYILSIKRLLLRIQSLRHGGSVVITPEAHRQSRHLSIKYKLNYTRLLPALHRMRASIIENDIMYHDIDAITDSGDSEFIPTHLYYAEAASRVDRDESESEIDGAIWYITLLSRVDGAIVISPDLSVVGFGAEIICGDMPRSVRLAKRAKYSQRQSTKLNYHHFGTRHRSMMRYCNKVPGSIGFIVSQDGDVRAMTKIGRDIVVWDNIRLTLFWDPNP